MFRFKVFENGAPAKSVSFKGAHLLGSDRVPLRAELRLAGGELICETKSRGAAALALMWPVKGVGRIMLETTRLMERQQPYNLHVELARGQLMRISIKREDWGLYDFAEGRSVYQQADQARDLLVEAITAPDDQRSAQLGDAATAASVRAAEALGMFHAEVFLKRRVAGSQLVKRPLGCRVDVLPPHGQPTAATNPDQPGLAERLASAFDFAVLPCSWRALEPREGQHKPEVIEPWAELLRQAKVPMWGHSLVSFAPDHLPDWVRNWSRDYEQLRERILRHLRYVLHQFGQHVRAWEVISGVHARNAFRLSFDQLMELTRNACLLVKQLTPRSKAVIGITLPWGEYYASDQRTIPPMLYAEMAVESGVNFDAFGVEMQFGGGPDGGGLYVRDLMQCSAMLDRFGGLGKPLHITAAGVPSKGPIDEEGCWRNAWSEDVQAEWAREFYRIALSKPFVETVSWRAFADRPDGSSFDGLLRADLSPKPAYEEILAFRREISPGRSP